MCGIIAVVDTNQVPIAREAIWNSAKSMRHRTLAALGEFRPKIGNDGIKIRSCLLHRMEGTGHDNALRSRPYPNKRVFPPWAQALGIDGGMGLGLAV